MAITIEGLIAGTRMAGSAVVVSVKQPAGHFADPDVSMRTMRMIRLRVYKDAVVEGNPYISMEWEADSDNQDVVYTQDISSALQALIDPINIDPRTIAGGAQLPLLRYVIAVGCSYMKDGKNIEHTPWVESTDDDTAVGGGSISSETMYAINGALNDYELMQTEGNGISETKVLTLSRKPQGEIVYVGHTRMLTTLAKRNTTQASPSVSLSTMASDTSISGLYLLDDPDFTEFVMINTLGGVESVCAHMLESASYDVDSQNYERTPAVSTRIDRFGDQLNVLKKKLYRSYEMSSGACTRQWAEWWTTEFLAAKRWWMKVGDEWLPCVVQPKGKTTKIYDRSKAEALHVDFTVTLAAAGSTELNVFNR